jgi:hypothetical protein
MADPDDGPQQESGRVTRRCIWSRELATAGLYLGLLVGVALLLPAGGANGAPSDLTFSGELQRVTADSIAIREADGIIIEAQNTASDGDLSPKSLSERYAVGDQVEITCARIVGVYSAQLDRRLYLRLQALRFLRAPSEEERRKALASRAWGGAPGNLLANGAVLFLFLQYFRPDLPLPGEALPDGPRATEVPNGRATEPTTEWPTRTALALLPDGRLELRTEPTPEWPAKLEQIRSHLLAYVKEMPNFVADEVAKRYASRTSPPSWRLVDTIGSEMTFHGGGASRGHITVNGRPWKSAYNDNFGALWTPGIGFELPCLLARGSRTTFEPEARVTEGGKSVSVVRYNSPPDGCGFLLSVYQQFYQGMTGRIWLDEPEENVIRLEEDSRVFPKDFSISAEESRTSWDFVKIGDATHLLPVSADITFTMSDGGMTLTRCEYKNHRHFEAASRITFQ